MPPSASSHAPVPPPPGSSETTGSPARPARGRRALVVGSVVAAVLLAGGAAAAVWGGGSDDEPAPAATATTSPAPGPTSPATPTPTPTPAPPVSTVDLSVAPTQTWQTDASTLMGGAPDSFVTLAHPDPLGRENVQETVVLAAGSSERSSIIGVDRATGTERWRTDLPPGDLLDCHVLGAGALTVCVAGATQDSLRVLTVDSTSGDIRGDDTVDFRPWMATEHHEEILLTGSTIDSGELRATRGTPRDLDARWAARSEPGYVPATEHYGDVSVSGDTVWSMVSGATMILDLRTGESTSIHADEMRGSAPWPGGSVLAVTSAGETARVEVTPPTGPAFTADGFAWTLVGPGTAAETVLGAGDSAYDISTGKALWSATPDLSALSTSYMVVDDLAVQSTWWEESVSLTAFDLATGAQRWNESTRSYGRVTRHADALFFDSSFGLDARDVATGVQLWNLDFTDSLGEDYFSRTTDHSLAGSSLVTVLGSTVTGYTFEG